MTVYRVNVESTFTVEIDDDGLDGEALDAAVVAAAAQRFHAESFTGTFTDLDYYRVSA